MQELYHDYIDHPGEVWRFELQFESAFCQSRSRITLREEFNENKMADQVLEYIGARPTTGVFSTPYFLQDVAFDRLSKPKQARLISRFVNS